MKRDDLGGATSLESWVAVDGDGNTVECVRRAGPTLMGLRLHGWARDRGMVTTTRVVALRGRHVDAGVVVIAVTASGSRYALGAPAWDGPRRPAEGCGRAEL